MTKNPFRPPQVNPATLRDQEIINRANADSPEPPQKKLLNVALDVQTDDLLHRLAILDRGRLVEAFARAVDLACRNLDEFGAFVRGHSGANAGRVVNKALWLPVESIQALTGLPGALQEHNLLIQSKSRIARLVLLYAGQQRGLDISGRQP